MKMDNSSLNKSIHSYYKYNYIDVILYVKNIKYLIK